jgi:transcriptional regulator with XRE-family HTH domain
VCHIELTMELRTARRIARLTQQELAVRAGVDDSFISLIESGKRDIRSVGYETVVRIARALGVEPDELFPVTANASSPELDQ